ncbi:imidazole glycerol phosphate synthase subunit HisH [Vallitalea pronyensis]|uniref:Imidazole glycerol phosphate synthase subunit HisH n=1 Tax=Vallitalea pronyensis TaxID=1348613 RepID=A0A8J8MLB6_9FIRM|nr:imidazole glycerol phosphate synthase subunit HisH [Vallitalea pronyensis]QUI23855.1 imidazole glycerol phosphate synthase subunit HisH [Vallitalea pronyensis]
MIGVIDYKAGNAPSVLNALNKLNIDSKLITSEQDMKSVSGIILPGVGSAKATMESLRSMKILEKLEEMVVGEGKPFLGICIGLQVLFEFSEEGDTNCLGWLRGCVKRFPESRVRVPHIGWNGVKFNYEHPIISKINSNEFFYFVNSYYVVPNNNDIILGRTKYGLEFCTMVAHKNIFATQFHVEKSGLIGLQLLKNFAAVVGGDLC